ncbi:beta-1,3-galactosyltransferase 2-like [Pelobates fuscus]|uniref:beta-1,3-galactosyltransferase 2-like n=1 Tax=Pelobates fuscus TaxID=191477 RepID=UPI002FE4F0B0
MAYSTQLSSVCRRKCFILLIYVIVALIFLSGYVYYTHLSKNYPLNQMQIISPVKGQRNLEVLERNTVKQIIQRVILNVSTSTQTSDPKTYLNINLYEYIINEPDKCKDQNPFLIFLISTIAKEVKQRQVIRNTWANEANGAKDGLTIMHLFMLGFENQADSKLILSESQKYHDIIQKDFKEAYNNLTFKTLMGMEWISTYCPQSKYVMKTDSDMFVNTEYLLEMLQPNLPSKQDFFTGAVAKDPVPHRWKESKWYVPYSVYPESHYPDFCSGTGYLLSGDLAPKILRSSYKIKYLHLEDVYVAICLKKEGIKITDPPTNNLFNVERVPFSPCGYYNLITSHSMPPSLILQYWQNMQEHKGQCSRNGLTF